MMPCDLPGADDARPELPVTLAGGCHCGAVRFRVTLRRWLASDCNCSLCTMKGYLHLIVPQGDFELLSPESAVTTYTFNTGVAKHLFCRRCGIKSFYVPRSHPDGVSVHAHCLDRSTVTAMTITPFDGQNWEAARPGLR